jgi:hypothetical protein
MRSMHRILRVGLKRPGAASAWHLAEALESTIRRLSLFHGRQAFSDCLGSVIGAIS